jgi:hypothetical protein
MPVGKSRRDNRFADMSLDATSGPTLIALSAYCVRFQSSRTVVLVEHIIYIVLLILGPIIGLGVWAYEVVMDSHGLRRDHRPATAPPLEPPSRSIQRPAA